MAWRRVGGPSVRLARAGSDRDKATAEYTRDKFLEFGLPQADIEEFQVLLNEPEADGAVVEILSPASAAFTAGLKEVRAVCVLIRTHTAVATGLTATTAVVPRCHRLLSTLIP